MSANFEWTTRKDQAAERVAQDRETDTAIAEACGVTQRTLERWKLAPEFQARVEQHRTKQRAAIEAKGIAEKQNRLDGYVARYQALQRVVAARSQAYKAAPGGDTGLIVGKIALVKVYASGDDEPEPEDGDETLFSAKRYRAVWEYSLDTGLLKEMRDLEKQIAQELGEWVNKQAMTNAKGEDLSLDQLMERYARAHGSQADADAG